MILHIPQGFAEPLEVYYLPLPQEADWVTYLRILNHAEDVIVGNPGFLLCCQILKQIRNWIALRLEFTGIEGDAASSLRPESGGVVNIVRTKAGFLDFLWRQIPGQLVDNSSDNFKVA